MYKVLILTISTKIFLLWLCLKNIDPIMRPKYLLQIFE